MLAPWLLAVVLQVQGLGLKLGLVPQPALGLAQVLVQDLPPLVELVAVVLV